MSPRGFLLLLSLACSLASPAGAEELRLDQRGVGPRSDDEVGVVATLSLEAAYLERDIYTVSNPGLGYVSRPFELMLGVPVEVLTVDLAPSNREQALFGLLRARTWLEGGEVGLPLLSRILTRVRVGSPGDLLHLRGGAVHHSLGHGGVVWRYTNSPDLDRRQAGAVLRLGTDVAGVEALLGNILAPQRVSAARLYLRPLLLSAPGPGLLLALGQRLALGAGYAADFVAPSDPRAVLADGSYAADGATIPLLHVFADAEAVLVDLGWLTAALYADLGLRRGLGGMVGGGGETGLLGRWRLWAATLALRAGLRLAADGYRSAELDAFYEIERMGRLSDGVPGASLAPVAGVGGVAEATLELGRWLRLRGQLDDNPGADNSNALLGVDLRAGPVRAGAALAQRGFEGSDGLLAFGEHTIGLAEMRIETIGPVAVVGRYWRTLRRVDSVQRLDDDLLIGVEVGWLLR